MRATEILTKWAGGVTCFANHTGKAQYIVEGDKHSLAACGKHLSRAIHEVTQMENPPMSWVTVWVKP